MFLCIKNKKKLHFNSIYLQKCSEKSISTKKIKKNINKYSYVLKIKKNLHSHLIYLQKRSEKPVPTKKIKKNVNKYSYIKY
jgi:hypothetical protein